MHRKLHSVGALSGQKIVRADPREVMVSDVQFADGIIMEPLGDGGPSGQSHLLVWNGERVEIATQFTHDDVTYVPATIDPRIVRGVRFPKGAASFGSTGELFADVSQLFSRATRLPDTTVERFASFVFEDQFADLLTYPPLLWVIAPSTASTGFLLQLLARLCRHSLILTELNLTALRATPLQLKPTIIAEVSSVSNSLIRALRASSRRDVFDASGGKLRDLSCARVVIANQPLRDPALAGFPLEIALSPTPVLVPSTDLIEAERVASQLFMYRLVNINRFRESETKFSNLTGPTQQLARSLAACIFDDEQLQSRIATLLMPQDKEIQVDRTTTLESIVVEALLARCHDNQSPMFSVGGLTKSVNTILVGRGELTQVPPEVVGWRLRSLGLRTEFVSDGRKGLIIGEETRSYIHQLASDYGVRTLNQGTAINLCKHCRSLAQFQNEPGLRPISCKSGSPEDAQKRRGVN